MVFEKLAALTPRPRINDLFLVVRVFSPDMKEVTFQGALDSHTPIAQGWLRASHRKLDPKLTLSYRPYHTHDEPQPLTPGQVYELDVEIWPTCIVVEAGYRIALTVRGRDYEYPGGPVMMANGRVFTGCGPFLPQRPAGQAVGNLRQVGEPPRRSQAAVAPPAADRRAQR